MLRGQFCLSVDSLILCRKFPEIGTSERKVGNDLMARLLGRGQPSKLSLGRFQAWGGEMNARRQVLTAMSALLRTAA